MNRSAMNMSALAGGLLLAGSMMAGVAAAAPADLNSVTVRTAREKGGFKAGLRRRDKSGLERG